MGFKKEYNRLKLTRSSFKQLPPRIRNPAKRRKAYPERDTFIIRLDDADMTDHKEYENVDNPESPEDIRNITSSVQDDSLDDLDHLEDMWKYYFHIAHLHPMP